MAALKRAARLGDAWMHAGGDAATLDRYLARPTEVRREYGREREPFEVHVIAMEAYTLSGMKRLEDRGITDCIVGFRNAYEKDTTPLQQKIDALRGYADRIIAKLWPGPTCVRASRRPTRRMGGSNFLKARPPKTPMKLAIIASALVVVIVSVAGAGYLAVRGIGAVAGTALTWLEPAVRSALPAEIARAEIQQRLDRTLALVRDGQLDGAEIEILAGKLDRVIAAPAPAPTPQAEG